MLKKYLKKTVGVIILFLLLINFYFAAQANAGAATDLEKQLQTSGGAWGGGVPVGEQSLAGIISTVVKAFLGLLGIIFLVLIIYAGFEWMTAQGDEEKVTKAKDTLTRAIIGLVIITAAYSITYFVFSSLPDGGGGGDTGASPIGGSPPPPG